MASTGFGSDVLWLVIAVVAVGTFLIRLSFIQLFGRMDAVPARVEHALRFVPAAVLTALVAPAYVPLDAAMVPTPDPVRLVAGGVAVLVAWRTESVVKTLAAGMVVLWVLGALV